MMAFSEDGLIVFIIAVGALIIPSPVYFLLRKAGRVREITTVERHEKPFDELSASKIKNYKNASTADKSPCISFSFTSPMFPILNVCALLIFPGYIT